MHFFAPSPYSAFLPLIQKNEASLKQAVSIDEYSNFLHTRQTTRPIDDNFADPSPFSGRDTYAKACWRQINVTIFWKYKTFP